jgi:DNA-binding transcriptional regulator YdaS (Cro superfamily)
VERDNDRVGFAEELGVHKRTVDSWCSGRKKPNRSFALAIERATHGAVTVSYWDTL